MRRRPVADAVKYVALARRAVCDAHQAVSVVVAEYPRQGRLGNLRDLICRAIRILTVKQSRRQACIFQPLKSRHAIPFTKLCHFRPASAIPPK